MRRTAGAASPASAALIRRRRDGDPTTLRDSFIHVLPGRRRRCARCYRNFAIMRQPGLANSRGRVAAAPCRSPSSLREVRIAPGGLAVLVPLAPLFPQAPPRWLEHLMVAFGLGWSL